MAQLGPNLQKKIANNPSAPQDVIVRGNGDMEIMQQELEAAGFQIRRRLGLIKGFAATAPGDSVRRAAGLPWVTSIEEDQQVHTM